MRTGSPPAADVHAPRPGSSAGPSAGIVPYPNPSTPSSTTDATSAAAMLAARPSRPTRWRLRPEADHQSGGCLSFHGRACSSWADREIRVPSSPIRPASITPIGRPSAFQCSGTFTAGWPDTL